MDITDNHFHLDPNGHKEIAVKSFLKAGGTRLVLVHKPYSPWKKISDFKNQVKITLKLSEKAREVGAKVAVISSPHPVQLVKLLDNYSPQEAKEIYLEAVDYCADLVSERVIVGLGELGRPHFEVNDYVSEIENDLQAVGLNIIEFNARRYLSENDLHAGRDSHCHLQEAG